MSSEMGNPSRETKATDESQVTTLEMRSTISQVKNSLNSTEMFVYLLYQILRKG